MVWGRTDRHHPDHGRDEGMGDETDRGCEGGLDENGPGHFGHFQIDPVGQ